MRQWGPWRAPERYEYKTGPGVSETSFRPSRPTAGFYWIYSYPKEF